MFRLVLASSSPRRKQILQNAGYEFEVLTLEISEILDENLSVTGAIEKIAHDKCQALVESKQWDAGPRSVVVAADTVVVYQSKVLGKPKDKIEAQKMLKQLSGNTHQVVTAVSFWNSIDERYIDVHQVSEVRFYDLTDEQIKAYVDSGDPMDKAGSYGIQSGGRNFVKEFTGDMDNIAGLPMNLVEQIFSENKWIFKKSKGASL